MSQAILLWTYAGHSSYVYSAKVLSGGAHIPHEEAIRRGLCTTAELERHSKSDYLNHWYDLEPGDQIEIEVDDGEDYEKTIFEIPEAPLPSPPQKLADFWKINLMSYFKQHCRCISSTTE